MSFCKKFSFSFEIAARGTKEGIDALHQAREKLCQLKPKYFSVTVGSRGFLPHQKSLNLVRQFVNLGIATTPHISCFNMPRQRLQDLLYEYKQLGIKQLLVIQGSAPLDYTQIEIEFNNAAELITAIRKMTGDYFHIIVAAYPEFHWRAKSPTMDIENFKRKIEAGANSAVTQFFFNSDAYFRFIEACDKSSIRIPITPGIVPIVEDYKKFVQICRRTQIPLWLNKHFKAYSDDPISLQEIGIEFISKLCHTLLQNGVKEFHFYPLNRAEPINRIIQNLL